MVPQLRSVQRPERLHYRLVTLFVFSTDSRKLYEKLIPGPLDIDPKVNATKFQCTGHTEDLLLIYAYSAPGNFEQRSRIRNSYGTVSF